YTESVDADVILIGNIYDVTASQRPPQIMSQRGPLHRATRSALSALPASPPDRCYRSRPDLVDLPAAHSERRGGAVEGAPTRFFRRGHREAVPMESTQSRSPPANQDSPKKPGRGGAGATGPRRERCAAPP